MCHWRSRLCGRGVEVAAAWCFVLRRRWSWHVARGVVQVQHHLRSGVAVAWASLTTISAIAVTRTALTALLIFCGRATLRAVVDAAAVIARMRMHCAQVHIGQARQRRGVHKIGRHCGLTCLVLCVYRAWAALAVAGAAFTTIAAIAAWTAFATWLWLASCGIHARILTIRAFYLRLRLRLLCGGVVPVNASGHITRL